MMHKFNVRLSMIVLLSLSFCANGQIPGYFATDTTGCGALLIGNYRQALEALWAEHSIADSGFWNFKKAVAHFNTNDTANALFCFLFSGKKDSVLSAVSFEYIGDLYGAKKRTREAVESYLRAQKDALHPDYYQSIRAKLSTLLNADSLLVDTIPFLAAWKLDTAQPLKEKTTAENRLIALDSLDSSMGRTMIDSILALLTDSVSAVEAAGLYPRLMALHVADSLLLTKRIFRISQIALQAKAPEPAAQWLAKASARPDFTGVIPARTLLWHQAFVEFGCSRYQGAVDLLVRYKKQYGPLPDLVLTLARAYHRLNLDAQSLSTYELFARLYPKDPKYSNVVWNLAWENDQKENFPQAIAYYKKLLLMKKNPVRAAEAMLRIGLCHYKAGEYGKACSDFGRLNEVYPDAPCAVASQYWKAQCYVSNGNIDMARKQFNAIIRASPTDYYAYRAIEALSLMGDTVPVCGMDTVRDYTYARQWLDSLSTSTKDTMSRQDSFLLERGTKLAFAGCRRLARLYIEMLEIRYPGNLQLQFDVGVLYKIIDDPVSSFRVGRRLIGRFPGKIRETLPLQVYALSYPFAYYDKIKRSATEDTVDPCLILGIIRQESVFNPAAVSRAGALGLMQLMPATAKAVAKELSEPFIPDSLTQSGPNIRYGVHYIKKLLDQFHGNAVRAIAGYNGGPPAITKWFDLNKKKTFDFFIEDIGYDETRGYVKKVLANYWTYRILTRLLNI
jgi:tetratricopeptide (TPR) repeat protein